MLSELNSKVPGDDYDPSSRAYRPEWYHPIAKADGSACPDVLLEFLTGRSDHFYDQVYVARVCLHFSEKNPGSVDGSALEKFLRKVPIHSG